MYFYRVNHGFQNLMFFFYFYLPFKRRKAQGRSIFKFQNAAIFLFFENFAVSVVHIAMLYTN